MIGVEDLYFEWVLKQLDAGGVSEGVAYLCRLLDNCTFKRRVGKDYNLAQNGKILRVEFLSDLDFEIDPAEKEEFLARDCSWNEMLVRLARDLDFLYDGGVLDRFIEMITNMNLDPILDYVPNRTRQMEQYDQHMVDLATSKVDNSRFDRRGRGGLFPLKEPSYYDQRDLEIWNQCAAYFRERFEGVLWTSTT